MRRVLRYALLVLLGVWAGEAQITTGSVTGVVRDPSARAVVGARIEMSGNGVVRAVESDAEGWFRLVNVPPGPYRLTVSANQFAKAMVNVMVRVQSEARVEVALELAEIRQSVETTARATRREGAVLGEVIDNPQVAGLPLNRRDFLQLALLVPGIAPPVEGSQLSQRQQFAMHANGAREESNNFLLDGVDNNDPNTNRYALQPPVDAIEEFQIATNVYSAEFGRNAGGQVNVVTRRGGNELHGFLYEYFRNRQLDARNFFSGAERPHFVRNQFGGGIGGPVRRDRTFFFANWDGLRERRGVPRTGTVPLEAVRRGDLSAYAGTPLDPFTRQPFAGKQIPASRIHPLAGRVLGLFPLPNLAGLAGNLLSQPVFEGDQTQWNARADHRWSDRDLLTFRYSHGTNRLIEPFAADTASVPGFGNTVRDRSHNALAQIQRSFSPRVTGSLLAGFNRVERAIVQQNVATDVNRLWGVNWLPTKPIDFGYPTFNIAGFSTMGDATQIPIDRAGNTYQLSGGIAAQAGAHGLKFGVEVRHNQHNGINNLLTRGSLTFSGAVSGTGASDTLLGLPALGIQSQADNVQTLRATSYNFYAQDDWRITPKLTLNLGARYEYNTPPRDPTGRITRVEFRPDRNNLAPRVGFAYAPDGRTTIRGGYGLYYDAGLLLANTALYFNPPYFAIRVFFPTATSLLSLSDPFPQRGGITPPASLSLISADSVTAYLQHWNFSVQRTTGAGVLSIAYAASKGTHLLRSRDRNQPRPAPGDLQPRRAEPQFANVFFTESAGNSSYQSLQASWNRPLARRWSMLAVYTFAKSIDDASGFLGSRTDENFPQDSLNFRAERARSSFDQRQRVSIASVWQAPGKFEVSLLASAATGQPVSPALRFDNSNTGNTGGQFGSDRPNLLGDPRLDSRTAERWFDPQAFAIPARFTFGNAGRNIVTGPGYASIDAAVSRTFRWRERIGLRAEAQAFNLFNRTNFDAPERFADEPTTFGRIFSAKAPRQIQLALRLTF